MATSFPSGLDSFTNPTAVDTLDSPPHDTQHADANDAIEALQAKVGVDGSAVTTSIDYQLNTGYRYHSTVYFTSSGTFTKASYPWLRAIKVRLVGGGCGGRGTTFTPGFSANGGGGGGYAESFITNIAGLSASETVTVGAGGAGGLASSTGGSGTSGGASSFGSLVAATGGLSSSLSSPGGIGTAGDLLIGGAAGAGGGNGSEATAGGNGGSSLLGGGGGGPVGVKTGGVTPGGSGRPYGGGGGGGMARNTTGANGGSGADGIVIVELYA